MPATVVFLLALNLAAPGFILSQVNYHAGLKSWHPDIEAWEQTTGSWFHAALMIDEEIVFGAKDLREKISIPAPGRRLQISIRPWQYYNLILDRIELLEAATGRTAYAVEAEQLLRDQTDAGRKSRGWKISPESRAYSGFVIDAPRITPADFLNWTIEPSPGEYRLRVHGMYVRQTWSSLYCALQWRIQQL